MSATTSPIVLDRYNKVALVLHWLIALLILGQIGFGWFLEEVPRGTPMRSFYVNLHKSTGLSVAVLILFRLGWRLTHSPPPLPSFLPTWERVAARTSHVLLYACMILMPLSGYVASNFSQYGVKLFNAVLLPPWGPEDKQVYGIFNATHVLTSYVFVALIAVHALAAVRHAVRRDGIFSRMLPLGSARPIR
jgi:cytochrome b561